jgi:hypothetical protein
LLCKRDGWSSKRNRSLGEKDGRLRCIVSAPSWHGKLSGFESRQTSLKVINGRHKQKSGQHTLACQKKYRKMFYILIRFSFHPKRRTNLLVGISFPVYISISTSRNGTQDDTLFVSGNKLLVVSLCRMLQKKKNIEIL